MKPHKPIDRESLLRLIHQSLDRATAAHTHTDAIADQNDGPLGLAVRQIMSTISAHTKDASTSSSGVNPVPLFDVAAYVDNMLEDSDKAQAITDAAITDPGLMMEIVAAVSAGRQPSTTSLSEDLRSRLIGLQPPSATNEVSHQSKPESTSITLTPTSRGRTRAQTRLRRSRVLTLGLAATAAALLLAVGWWFSASFGDHDVPVAREQEVAAPEVPREQPSPVVSNDAILVESLAPDSDPIEIPKLEQPPSPEPSSTGEMSPEPPTQSIANDPVPKLDAAPGTIVEMPRDNETMKEPTRLVANWNQIDGLLLKSTSSRTDSSSSSRPDALRAVTEGSTLELATTDERETLQLQTLPLCRATATLSGGDKLVLAADTQIQLTNDGVISLRHGSIALMAPETKPTESKSTVRFGKTLNSSVPIQAQAGSTVLVRKTVDGIEVEITGSDVTVGQRIYARSRLSIGDTFSNVQRIADASERLPRWTRQRVDRIELGRNVLAQFASSGDVQSAMMQSLRSGTVQGKSAATIRGWLVSSSGDNLIRMIASQDPLIREAALGYLRMITPSDPRHQLLWRRLQAKSSNPRIFVAIRSYFLDVWASRRPDTTKRDQLLRMVQSNDAATQVIANYLLTVFYGPGPRFQLGANANTKTRAVNAWRTVVSRSGF